MKRLVGAMRRFIRLSFVMMFVAGGVAAVGGVVGVPLATLLFLGGVLRRGVERTQLGRAAWFAQLPDWFQRSVPLAIAVAGGVAAMGARSDAAWGGTAATLLQVAAAAAVWDLGHRAGRVGFQARDYGRDIVFGPTGWAVVAAIGASSVQMAAPGGLGLAAAAIVGSCGMLALSDEPMYVTRRAIRLHAFARLPEAHINGTSTPTGGNHDKA